MWVDREDELALGVETYRALLENLTLSTDPALNAAVREVGERIAAAAERPDLEWEFAVIEAPEANAFALPGGKVAVHTGLFPIARDTAGLAAVLGHEIAHAIARHASERLSSQQLIEALTGVAGSAVGDGLVGGLVGTVASAGATIALNVGLHFAAGLPFTRAQESEADHIGLILMAKAGYDPSQALALWQRFESLERDSRPTFLSAHPDAGARREDLATWLAEAQGYFAAAQTAPVRELSSVAGW